LFDHIAYKFEWDDIEVRRIGFEILVVLAGLGNKKAQKLLEDGPPKGISYDTQRIDISENLSSARFHAAKYKGCLYCGISATFGLQTDGTIIVAGGYNTNGNLNVGEMRDIVAFACGFKFTVGLQANGTVTAVGRTYSLHYKWPDIRKWQGVTAIAASGHPHADVLYALKQDGTVESAGEIDNDWNYGQDDVKNWRNIIEIAAGATHTIGLKSDGTVVATGCNDYGECNVKGWHGIVAVSAGGSHTVGLKFDGTVVATGCNDDGECNTKNWRDVVAISAKYQHTIGLRADGSVVATGAIKELHTITSEWKDIVEISSSTSFTAGLKSDGTVVAVGENDKGQCNVQGWQNIGPSTEEQRNQRRKKDEKRAQNWMNQGMCRYCGGRFKGLFSKKCSNEDCAKHKDY